MPGSPDGSTATPRGHPDRGYTRRLPASAPETGGWYPGHFPDTREKSPALGPRKEKQGTVLNDQRSVSDGHSFSNGNGPGGADCLADWYAGATDDRLWTHWWALS